MCRPSEGLHLFRVSWCCSSNDQSWPWVVDIDGLTKLLQEVGSCTANIFRRELEFFGDFLSLRYQIRSPGLLEAVGRHWSTSTHQKIFDNECVGAEARFMGTASQHSADYPIKYVTRDAKNWRTRQIISNSHADSESRLSCHNHLVQHGRRVAQGSRPGKRGPGGTGGSVNFPPHFPPMTTVSPIWGPVQAR